MKEDVPANPVDVRLLGPATVVPHTHRRSHAIEELRRRPTFWNVHGGHRWEATANTVPLVMTLGSRENLIEFGCRSGPRQSGRRDERGIFNTPARRRAQILRITLSTPSSSGASSPDFHEFRIQDEGIDPLHGVEDTGREPASALEEHPGRIFDELFDLDEELNGRAPVDQPVVVGERDVHHRPDHHLWRHPSLVNPWNALTGPAISLALVCRPVPGRASRRPHTRLTRVRSRQQPGVDRRGGCMTQSYAWKKC